MSQSESSREERLRSLTHENERLKEEAETARHQTSSLQLSLHETSLKLDSYQRDYERYFTENKRLRDLSNSLRDDKDSALSELSRLKSVYHERLQEMNDECNLKLAQLENALIETKERARFQEEKAFEVMRMQERMVEKWKTEHKATVEHYEKGLRQARAESRHAQEKVIELKGQLKLEKENNDQNLYDKMKKSSSKSKERERSKGKKSKE